MAKIKAIKKVDDDWEKLGNEVKDAWGDLVNFQTHFFDDSNKLSFKSAVMWQSYALAQKRLHKEVFLAFQNLYSARAWDGTLGDAYMEIMGLPHEAR